MSTESPEIRWHQWSRETLELAEKSNKPILLSISATWCHWCHVMDQKTFSDAQVIDIINSRFLPVRADTDRRPDLNARFNMGGWPTIAFLTPKGDILSGATYLPPKRLIEMSSHVARIFSEERAEIEKHAEERLRQREIEAEKGQLSLTLVENLLAKIEEHFDPIYGGFGTEQKFPHVPALEFLLSSYRRTGHRDYLNMAMRTLDAMQDGEIRDKVGGGFFRYSTNRDWSVPHYEKMLEDNAGLLSVYTYAHGLTGEKRYLDTAESIVCYLEESLFDEDTKAFFGSQDSEESYYRLSEDEREHVTPPSVDRTIYVDWNAIAADAYIRFYEATGDYAQLDRAIGVLDFLLEACRSNGSFLHYFDGTPKEPGLLSDQVWAGIALLRAYESTGQRRFLTAAKETAESVIRLFSDPTGGLFDITEERMQSQGLRYREKLLNQNPEAARFFTRLSYYAHEPSYRNAAEAALWSVADPFRTHGLLSAPYALALVELLEEPVKVAVTGQRDDPKTEELISSTLKAKDPSSLVQILGSEATEEDLQQFRIQSVERPHAVICVGSLCHSIDNPEMLRTAILEAEETRG